MRSIFLFIVFYLFLSTCYPQARVVFNGAYVVLSNGTAATPIYFVTQNSATNAITRTSGGIICSETGRDYNRVLWNIGTSTGNYIFPFTTTTTYIPFEFNISVAGVGAGRLNVSTWYTSADVTLPSTVTSLCAHGNENEVLDRFWVITPTGYTTNPTAAARFRYTAADYDGVYGESNLLAQRWGTASPCEWETPIGTYTAGTPSYVDIPATLNFSSWTLSNKNNPLPITLLSFIVSCSGVVEWKTASETNNEYFIIEKSSNGTDFVFVNKINGAINSSTQTDYQYLDEPIHMNMYYRLTQIDIDGKATISAITHVKSCNLEFISIENKKITIYSITPSEFHITNLIGQIVMNGKIYSGTNIINCSNFSSGIYFINNQKIVLQ